MKVNRQSLNSIFDNLIIKKWSFLVNKGEDNSLMKFEDRPWNNYRYQNLYELDLSVLEEDYVPKKESKKEIEFKEADPGDLEKFDLESMEEIQDYILDDII